MLLQELIERCANNSICIVEGYKLMLDKGYDPSQDEVKFVSALLGEPTKRLDVLKSRYIDVFTRLLEKNCYHYGGRSLCIYSWNPKVPVRYFPVSLDATGTILLFDDLRVSLVAYPTHRAYDLESRGVGLPDPENMRIVETTSRIDGYQITFYFNPMLERWIPATRYALHNMRYIRGRLVVGELDRVINPYAAAADHLADSGGLYDRVKNMRGWTFTFVLEAPEPAILKPNVELYDHESFRLYVINARSPDGRLLTASESSRLVGWEHIPIERVEISNMADLKRYIDAWSKDVFHRSRFIRFSSQDQARPYTVEVKSKLYESAVLVKHSSDPRSLLVLASYGFSHEAVSMLTDYRDIRSVGREICELYQNLKDLVSETLDTPTVEELMRELGVPRDLFGELEKARRSGDIDRFVRKLSLALSGESLYDTRDKLKAFVSALKERRKKQ